ncbi:MAG: hypothetical protein J5449_10270 [Oscillospiraceae bacterium]|nr:hypothetical protein [Oscillospiraceae bacterium]
MKKRSFSLIGVAFAVLLVFVIAFFIRLTMYKVPEVKLAEGSGTENSSDPIQGSEQEAIRRIEVTPNTVQLVIERLERPASYSRSIVIERYWTGGSGVTTAQVCIANGWTRTDVGASGEEQRHSITGDGKSWIWYGSGERVFTGKAALSADEEQSIPTYEDILEADNESIAVADYRLLETVSCIFVETVPDELGYGDRWWVSAESGLLVAAERFKGDTVVYRMAGLPSETEEISAEAFTLPDGTVLYDPSGQTG